MKPATNRIGILILIVVGTACFGGIIGLVLGSQPTERGFSIGAPPEPIAHIAAANTLDIVVQSQAGSYYTCAAEQFPQGASCWQKSNRPDQNSIDILNAPQIDDAEFAPPPSPIREHWTVTFYDSIGGSINETRYALLEDGTVWVWPAETNQFLNFPKSAEQVIGASIGLCCLGLVGLVIALLLGFIWTRSSKNQAAAS